VHNRRIEPVEGAGRLRTGDCIAYVPDSMVLRCEREAGHGGEHVRGDRVWR
jgi:hypothetical protein